jgi:hypothetical protein
MASRLSTPLHPGSHASNGDDISVSTEGTDTPVVSVSSVPSKAKSVVVFSGGSAANSLVDVFSQIVMDKRVQISYVIPISDNGGSSSELIRVFGGPGTIGGNVNFILRVLTRSRYW